MKLCILIAAALAGASLQVHAQMVVTDPGNLAEALKQVQAWQQQYQQMQSQITAMTGDRGMSRLLPTSTPMLPSNWSQSMSSLTSLAQQIRQSQAVLTPTQAAQLSPDVQQYLSNAQTLSAANQALAQTAYNDAAARQARLQTLNNTLATTTDPKAAYDLANRISIEHAELTNDQHQLESAAYNAAEQERARRLQVAQMRAASFGTEMPKIDSSLP
jgi:type IV secretion system protein VirB5